jgi:hypothetical protein
MAAEKSGKRKKQNLLTSRQHAFIRELAKGSTHRDAPIKAGYKAKHPDQVAHQALKGIQQKVPALMVEVGLTDRVLIDIEEYLVPLLRAKETKFFKDGDKRINVAALGIRHTALDTAFKLRGSYAPRDPKEAAQFGNKVIVVDIPRPPRNAIDVTPGGAGGNGTPPTDNDGGRLKIYTLPYLIPAGLKGIYSSSPTIARGRQRSL